MLFEVSPITATRMPSEKEGHACLGYSFNDIDYWFDKDTDVLVIAEKESKSKPGSKEWIYRLLNFKNEAAPQAWFVVPSDYKVSYGLIP